jgi:hypothetical protein
LEGKKKRRGGLLLIVLSVLLLLGGGYFGIQSLFPTLGHPGALTDMRGNAVLLEDPSAVTPEFREAAQMVENDGGQGFQVPALNLSVPLGSVNEVNNVMNPPSFTSVFWIRNRGVSLEQANLGTVYLVAHAIQGGTAPGNFMQANGDTNLKPGDVIKVNDRVYEFVSSLVKPKAKISEVADLWTDEPGRMFFITCVLNPNGGLAVDNLILEAKLVS